MGSDWKLCFCSTIRHNELWGSLLLSVIDDWLKHWYKMSCGKNDTTRYDWENLSKEFPEKENINTMYKYQYNVPTSLSIMYQQVWIDRRFQGISSNSLLWKRNKVLVVQPIPLGVTFSKAQSSKLERLFCHVSVKRDIRALSFELWALSFNSGDDRLRHKFVWAHKLKVSVGSEIGRIPLNTQRPSRACSAEKRRRVKYVVPFVDLKFMIFHISWPLLKHEKI